MIASPIYLSMMPFASRIGIDARLKYLLRQRTAASGVSCSQRDVKPSTSEKKNVMTRFSPSSVRPLSSNRRFTMRGSTYFPKVSVIDFFSLISENHVIERIRQDGELVGRPHTHDDVKLAALDSLRAVHEVFDRTDEPTGDQR